MNKKIFLCVMCAIILTACSARTSSADIYEDNNIPMITTAPETLSSADKSVVKENIPKITEPAAAVSANSVNASDKNIPETSSAQTEAEVLYDDVDISQVKDDDIIIQYTDNAVPYETETMTSHDHVAAATVGYSLPANADTETFTESDFSDISVFNDLEPYEIDGYLVRCTSGDVLFVSENYGPILIGADGDFPERQTGDEVSIKILILMESYPMQIPDDSEFYFGGGHTDVNDMSDKIINDLIDLRDMGYIVPEMPEPKDVTGNDPAYISGIYRMSGVYYDDQSGNNFILTENRDAVIIYGDVDFSNLSDGDFITVAIAEIEESYPGRGMIFELEKLPFAYDGFDPEIITEVLDNLESEGYILANDDI